MRLRQATRLIVERRSNHLLSIGRLASNSLPCVAAEGWRLKSCQQREAEDPFYEKGKGSEL